MENVKFKKQVFNRRGGVTKVVPLVITYHALPKSVGAILYKHLYLLHMDKEVKNVFPVAPIYPLQMSQLNSNIFMATLC